jgi:hypothetical protein
MQNVAPILLVQLSGEGECPNITLQRRSDQEHMDEHATALNDNAAALDYACHMVRELRTNGGYDDPELLVTVRNEMRQIVLSIPFLPACA